MEVSPSPSPQKVGSLRLLLVASLPYSIKLWELWGVGDPRAETLLGNVMYLMLWCINFLFRMLTILVNFSNTMIQSWVFPYQREPMQKIVVFTHQRILRVPLLMLWIRWMYLFLLISLDGFLR